MEQNKEGFATVTVNGERHEARQDNTSVYRHLGKFALYDHVFTSISENSGVYIWKHNPSHAEFERLAIESECPTHLFIPEVSEVDRNAYESSVLADLSKADTFPEDWQC